MVERLVAAFGGGDGDAQVVQQARLAHKLIQTGRAQRSLKVPLDGSAAAFRAGVFQGVRVVDVVAAGHGLRSKVRAGS